MTLSPAQRPGGRRFRLFRSVSALILREMVTTYGRSPGGYLWVILEPVAGIALLSYVFSLIARTPSLGQNFPLFFATGILPFLLYSSISGLTANSLKYSKPFLAYPAVTYLDALIARIILTTLTHLLVSAIILTGIIMIYDLRPILHWPAIFNALAMTLSFAVAIGTLNCYLFTIAPLWERFWTVLNRPMFILSGILFIPENVPARLRDYFMMIPLPHMTSEMRKGFYATYDAVHVQPIYVYLLAVIILTIGMILLLRNHKLILEL
ncbi:ABC transporter permease [Marinovum sp.]|uniref:ABC transporter permease n=1 Tax=Marinovum sp. TaxID=2024839 RepID=UPI003A93EC4E